MISNAKRKPFTLAEAKQIGEKLGIDWSAFDVNQFHLGMNTEFAAGTYNPLTNFASDDPILIGKVVRGHLNKRPDYYTHWAEREKEAELEQRSKRTRNPAKAKPKSG